MPVSPTLLIPDPRPLVERLGQSFFRQRSERPGVYLMRVAAEVVLYMGKAKSLRHRRSSCALDLSLDAVLRFSEENRDEP